MVNQEKFFDDLNVEMIKMTILKVMLVMAAMTMKIIMIIQMKIRAGVATIGIAMITVVAHVLSGTRSGSISNSNYQE